MIEKRTNTLPRRLFASHAVGGFIASGIFIGIMSLEGLTIVHLLQVILFGILGMLM